MNFDTQEQLLKPIPNICEKSRLSREYFLALGGVEHYLKRVQQFHEYRRQGDALPPRWLHLAERTLLHRPVLKYQEFFNSSEYEALNLSSETIRLVEKIDKIVEEINSMLGQENIISSLRDEKSTEYKTLKNYYTTAKRMIFQGVSC